MRFGPRVRNTMTNEFVMEIGEPLMEKLHETMRIASSDRWFAVHDTENNYHPLGKQQKCIHLALLGGSNQIDG